MKADKLKKFCGQLSYLAGIFTGLAIIYDRQAEKLQEFRRAFKGTFGEGH